MSYAFITEEDFKIASENNIPKTYVYNRVYRLGWGIERAVSEPLNPRGNRSKLYGDDIRALAKEKGVSYAELNRRITKQGMTPLEAVLKGCSTQK